MSSSTLKVEANRANSASPFSSSGIGPKLVVGAVFVIASFRLLLLTHLYAVNILFRDQWSFDDATLFERHSLMEIFRWQYGPHRQGLGGVLSKLIEPAIHWNSRYEAFGIVSILMLASILALWLKKRVIGAIDYPDIAIPLLFLTPVQYQVIFEGTNPSHGPFPVLLAVCFCLAWTIRKDSLRWPLVLALNLFLIYTGFGLFMGIVTPVLLAQEYWSRRNWKVWIVLGMALLSFGSFFIGYRIEPAVACFSPKPGNPFYYALFTGFMLSTFAGVQPVFHLVAAIFLGLALLVLVSWSWISAAAFFWRRGQASELTIFAFLSYSVLFMFGTAYGRICLGLSAAQASRYTCYMVLAFFGLYLLARRSKSPFFAGGVLALALMSSLRVNPQDEALMARVSSARKGWADCFRQSHDVNECGARTQFSIYQTPEPPDLKRKLEALEARHLNLFSQGPK